MGSQIPHLLESYLALPPETSQLLLTGVLGASTNWLVLRHLYSLLRPSARHRGGEEGASAAAAAAGRGETRVLLVSFMRDYAFWKDGAGRLVRTYGLSEATRVPFPATSHLSYYHLPTLLFFSYFSFLCFYHYLVIPRYPRAANPPTHRRASTWTP